MQRASYDFVIFVLKQIMNQTQLFEEDQEPSNRVPKVVPKNVKSVLVPYPVDKAYDYALPDGMHVEDGDYVCVPLGGHEVPGVVWGAGAGDVPLKKLKSVVSLYDIHPMPEVHRRFIDWTASYNVAAKGAVLKMALSVSAALEAEKPVTAYRISPALKEGAEKGLSPQRRKVLEVLSDGQARRPSEIADLAGCSASVVKGLADKGYVEAVELPTSAPCRHPDPLGRGATLSKDQASVAKRLRDYVEEGGYNAALLDGVTGAGKTEVYFEAVAKALEQDEQVLILLPEIALSNAFLDRFKSRFGCAPALWHSGLTPAQRRRTWRGVAQGESKVVVGARSALYLPYADLGLIIVDEEHDPAYKQEDGVIYHARDMAIVRAHLGKIPIVLVSATPSLETIHNTWGGRYEHLHLPARFGGAQLPDISMIDLREDKPERQHFIAPTLKAAMVETLQKGEQVMLFLNRRGYAPLTLCRTCGHRVECPRCTAWLVEHKARGKLQCHHCGFSMRTPHRCPECDAKDSLAACGPGVERIYEEARSYFPDARISILASDTAESDQHLKDMLADVREGKIDIVIGTQIIAKGHHFPNLTCVGVIDADLGLQGGELRASERTYQLLHQVAGRAGREAKKGHVYLQSFMPDHPIMRALTFEARDAFLEAEAHQREMARMPPYSRLVGVIIAGRDEGQVIGVAKALGQCAPQGETIQTLGPAPAPLAKLRGRHRYRLLVRADKEINVQKTVRHWTRQVKTPSNVRVYIDIDPQSFL